MAVLSIIGELVYNASIHGQVDTIVERADVYRSDMERLARHDMIPAVDVGDALSDTCLPKAGHCADLDAFRYAHAVFGRPDRGSAESLVAYVATCDGPGCVKSKRVAGFQRPLTAGERQLLGTRNESETCQRVMQDLAQILWCRREVRIGLAPVSVHYRAKAQMPTLAMHSTTYHVSDMYSKTLNFATGAVE